MAILQADNKRATLHGVILMIISGFLCAVISISMQWYSEKKDYSIPQILLHISLFQLLCTLISSVIILEVTMYPSCKINFSINLKNTLNGIESVNDNQYIFNRRVSTSTYSSRRSSMVMPHKSYSNSISYASTQYLYNPNPTNYLSFNHNNSITPKKPTKKDKVSLFFIEEISPKKIWILILLRGIFGTLAIFTFLESQKIIPIIDSLTVKPFSIITSTIIGYIVLADPLSKYHVIALMFGIIGSLMIAQPPFIMQVIYTKRCYTDLYSFENQWLGYLLAFISSFCAGIVFLCIRITQKAPSFLIILSESLCNIVGCVIMIKFWDNDQVWIGNDWINVLYAVLFGIILYFSALTLTRGSQKLIIGASNVIKTGTHLIFGLIFEIIITNVYPNWITIIGAILSIIGVILISLEKVKKAHRKSLFELFDTRLDKYDKYHGDTEKDMVDTYYTFDEDEQGGYTTLIM